MGSRPRRAGAAGAGHAAQNHGQPLSARVGLEYARVTRAPAAVRFQARRSNELWQFDMSPSDLKHVKQPLWIESGRGAPTLMLFSVADDRSGVVYQEYRCVYGEDAESALRFLYNAMAAKPEEDSHSKASPKRSTWTTVRSPARACSRTSWPASASK